MRPASYAPSAITFPRLSLADLKKEAALFAKDAAHSALPDLYGITDGKAVGTYVEIKFHDALKPKYAYDLGSAASGIDFPDLNVDLKATSIKQPQSSCPYRSARQKVYGLGYDLLVFVYEKKDDPKARAARLDFLHTVFIHRDQTADYQTTTGIRTLLANNANRDDIVAFLEERNLPLEELGREQLADEILTKPPIIGYLTISNALQWRLQYRRVVELASKGKTEGIESLS